MTTPKVPIILALDISSTHIGICYDGHPDNTIKLTGKNIADRCSMASQKVSQYLADRKDNCDLVVIESPVAKFAKAVIPQSRVAGAVIAHIAFMGIAWVEVAPTEVKRTLTGKGNADKAQMIAAAREEFCDAPLDEHQADAYGLWLVAKNMNVEVVL